MKNKLTPKGDIFTSYQVPPFLPSIYTHNSDLTTFPPVWSNPFLWVATCYSWTNEMLDEDVHNAVRSSAKALFNVAMSVCAGCAVVSELFYL